MTKQIKKEYQALINVSKKAISYCRSLGHTYSDNTHSGAIASMLETALKDLEQKQQHYKDTQGGYFKSLGVPFHWVVMGALRGGCF